MLICMRNLGAQSNPENVILSAIYVANSWAPRGAKSFTVSLRHTDYHGTTVDSPTGYASTVVRYFSTKREGLLLVRGQWNQETKVWEGGYPWR